MNPDLNRLQPYPFEKLRTLKQGIVPPADKLPIALSIGEPKHSPPAFVIEEIIKHLQGVGSYPLTKGITAKWLRNHIKTTVSYWTQRLPDYLPVESRQRLNLLLSV